MKNLAIARRYAKALLLIGKEDGRIDTYRDELGFFTKLIEQEKNLQRVLVNPLYDSASRKKVLTRVTDGLKLSQAMTTFILFLFDKGRIGFLASINDCFQKFADELKGVARASLVSAAELPAEAIEKIRSALSKKTGKDIIFEVEQDPELIGGIVTRIGDLVLDGSVRTQLLNLRESLKRGERV